MRMEANQDVKNSVYVCIRKWLTEQLNKGVLSKDEFEKIDELNRKSFNCKLILT